jgi:hypothetical protein
MSGPPFCGCTGCRDDANVVVRHPKHGPRATCYQHARDYPVIPDLTAEMIHGV